MPIQEIRATITEDNYDLTSDEINQYEIILTDETLTVQAGLLNPTFNILSASYAQTSSYYNGSVVSSSYALTSSYAENAGSSGLWTESIDGSISRLSDIGITGSLLLKSARINAYEPSDFILQVGSAWNDGGALLINNGNTTMIRIDPNGFTSNVYWKAGDGNPPWTPGYAFLNALGVGIGQLNTTDLVFYTGNNDRMRILTDGTLTTSGSTHFGNTSTDIHQFTGSLNISGSVGINTTSSLPLHVRGLNGTNAQDEIMRISNEGTYDGNFRFKVGSINARGGRLQFYEGDYAASYIDPDIYDLRFGSGQGSIEFYTNLTQKKMTITNAGDLKVGTTSANVHQFTGSLNVSGTINVRPNLFENYFSFQKPDGTSLWNAQWDTGNFHHYFSNGMYWNMAGNYVTIDDAVGGGGIRMNNKASILGDPLIDGSTALLTLGNYSYATAVTPLAIQKIFNAQTFAWNGSNGYTTSSFFSLYAYKDNYVVGSGSLVFTINSVPTLIMKNRQTEFKHDVQITGSVDIASGSSVILSSPNGTRFKLTISDTGVVSSSLA